MKRVLFFLSIACSLFFVESMAQEVKLKKKTLKAEVTSEHFYKGYLLQLHDSSMELTTSKATFGSVVPNNSQQYSYSQIKKVTIQRKGSVGRGAIIGAASGMIAGVLAGLIEGNDKIEPPSQDDPFGIGTFVTATFYRSTSEKVVGYGVSGIIGGAAIGAIVGAVTKKTFIINGSKEKYYAMRNKMNGKLYRNVAF